MEPVKYCDYKGCDKPCWIQSIGGFCPEHQKQVWDMLIKIREKNRAIDKLTGLYSNPKPTRPKLTEEQFEAFLRGFDQADQELSRD